MFIASFHSDYFRGREFKVGGSGRSFTFCFTPFSTVRTILIVKRIIVIGESNLVTPRVEGTGMGKRSEGPVCIVSGLYKTLK